MDLNTQGYIANGIYDRIQGIGGYGNEDVVHGYERTQAIKDQASLINMYQDNKNERRGDKIDKAICENEKDNIRGFAAVIAAQKDCCCETQLALAALNGKVDANAEKTVNQILLSQMAITAKMDTDTIATLRHNDTLKSAACNFAERGLFPFMSTCSK